MHLADTSAWVWTRVVGGELRSAFDDDVIEGQVATCEMVCLELLYSARNPTELDPWDRDAQAAVVEAPE